MTKEYAAADGPTSAAAAESKLCCAMRSFSFRASILARIEAHRKRAGEKIPAGLAVTV